MRKIKLFFITMALFLATLYTVTGQSSVVIQQFTSPSLEVLQGSANFFSSSTPKIDLQTNNATKEVPPFFNTLLSTTTINQLDQLCDKNRLINNSMLSRSISEISNFRTKGTTLFVEATIYFTLHQEDYCFVKFSIPTAETEDNIYGAYLFRKDNGKWLYSLNTPMPMQTFTVLVLKPNALKSLLTDTQSTSQIKKDLPAYCFGFSNNATDLRTIGREIASYFAPKTENLDFIKKYCHPIKLR